MIGLKFLAQLVEVTTRHYRVKLSKLINISECLLLILPKLESFAHIESEEFLKGLSSIQY
jgi:hypothetical protein